MGTGNQMKELLKPLLENGKLLILGFGREGQSTYRYIRRQFPDLAFGIADHDNELLKKTGQMLDYPRLALYLGENYLDALGEYSLVIKSPGVSIPESMHPGPGIQVTSQTRLMLKAFHRQIIGITGTKGKSTTSSLVHHLLITSGIDSVLVGNIGLPPFDYLDNIGQDTKVVFEMSSHQLEDSILAPHISVLLNLYPEHLDRYPSLEAYYGAKMRIFTRQADQDIFIYNEDIPGISERIGKLETRRKFLSYSSINKVANGSYLSADEMILCDDGAEKNFIGFTPDLPLKGEHNRMNMMAALLAAREAGAADENIIKGLYTFKPLEHRLEFVGEFRGIKFYNDSIATIPEATIAAVRTLPDTDTLLLGGYDRMLDYGDLIAFLKTSGVRNLIFMGKAGLRMYQGFHTGKDTKKRLFIAGSFDEAFKYILQNTAKGKICLLSPAAASYDIFRNFEERGQAFKEIARSL